MKTILTMPSPELALLTMTGEGKPFVLNRRTMAELEALLEELQKSLHLTMLFISHDLSVVRCMTDRAVVMYLGKIMEMGPTEHLFGAPAHPYTRNLIDAVPEPDPDCPPKESTMIGEPPSPMDIPGGCRFHPRCPYAKNVCRRAQPELTDLGGGHFAACHFRRGPDNEYGKGTSIMKITGVKIEKLLLELTSPFRVAFGTITHSENVMIKVTTDEGVTGYGEAAPLAFVTAETTDSVIAALELFRTGLIGMDPLDIEAVHAMMDGLMGGNSSAKCAVDLAMYDIRGKAAGMPVYKLLGGYSNTVLNDITVSIMEPQAMADKALSYVRDKGYRVLKVKVGADVNDDIRALTLIREAVGPDVRLRVDANQGYDVPTALKALNAFAALGVESVEQCLPAWNMEGAAYLRRKAPAIHLMLDESIHGPVDAARACRMDAADILNIKLMKCGGLYNALKIVSAAEVYGVECMIGCMLESKLAVSAAAHLAAAKRVITRADLDGPSLCKTDPFTGGPLYENGVIRMTDAPGIGITRVPAFV